VPEPQQPGPLFLCGGSEEPGPRDECPNALHDHPLPSGYTDAFEAAGARTRKGWHSRRCPDCNLYGWVPPLTTTT